MREEGILEHVMNVSRILFNRLEILKKEYPQVTEVRGRGLLKLSLIHIFPVISPVAADENGITLNINADHLAGSLAGALKADKLIMLTDVEGIMRDPGDMSSLIEELTIDEAKEMTRDGHIVTGMIPKVEACFTALQGGVERTHIIDGRRPHSLLLEMFTDKGCLLYTSLRIRSPRLRQWQDLTTVTSALGWTEGQEEYWLCPQ